MPKKRIFLNLIYTKLVQGHCKPSPTMQKKLEIRKKMYSVQVIADGRTERQIMLGSSNKLFVTHGGGERFKMIKIYIVYIPSMNCNIAGRHL